MKSFIFVPLLCLVALGAREAVAMLVCWDSNYCGTVQCTPVDSQECEGEVRQNATVCGCCAACITIFDVGSPCPQRLPGRRPGYNSTWECAPGSFCMNYQCTAVNATESTEASS